ncbi:MAG TPA: peptide-N-glycosidase F-related protein, partial [bacterium]|nr:peptide-N-glycosidase F-related protein [bacterium]
QGDVEVARLITPYDITGSGFPGSCTWSSNVTRYKSLLQDTAELRLYVESWIGGTNGWLVSIDFAFIEGTLDPEPYRVVNLWRNDWVEYGNPDDPFSDHVQPMMLDVPGDATKVNVSMFVTGHGQGNTDNCAEFCPRTHSLWADGTEIQQNLWRANCWNNVCSPQGGTWSLSRAGWCPGDEARAWTADVTAAVTPGQSAVLDYQVEQYENLCRPGNPDCVPGVTCTDCNYNTTGHTTPHYTVQGQAIFWKPRASVVDAEIVPAAADGFSLDQNSPNPFRPGTAFAYSLPRAGAVTIAVHDAAGRRVLEARRTHAAAGAHSFTWDGRESGGRPVAAGVYFYSVTAEGRTLTRKMVRLQ